ncbi:hypothetical protein O1R50_12865 [Glycomyces luteolus]|uniref:DUF4352 domain-containing protein n=1 Tax=Glycomyces luteolus TaxID=2670330 RepID=A0A9X3SQT3_9ACTN|nr:hypothetical protein [Glycomyces luteolus]MDA1360521.1 hypothetical protein [Glycomyces luteolus]
MNLEFPEISKRLLAASGAGLIALAALSACGAEDTGSGDTSNTADEAATEAAAEEEAASTGDGTSPDAPLAAGSTIEVADWSVTAPEATLDATDAILAADEFNAAPADGFQQSLITLEGTYNGTETGSLWLDVTFGVWADGTFYDSIDCMNTVENEITLVPDVSSGATSTGSACVEVPADAESYLLYFEDVLSMDGTQYFVEIG